MVTENTTPNRGYQEPAVGNTLEVDVGRLIAALRAIDVDVANALAAIVSKAGLASPAFTGTPTAPTAAPGTDSGQLATTAFVKAALAALVGLAPETLDTIEELAAASESNSDLIDLLESAVALKADAAATTAALAGKADANVSVRVDAAQSFTAAQQAQARTNISAALKGHLYGLTLTNNASDAANDIDIAAGEAASTDTASVLMVLASALTKRLDAAWAVGSGNGGLDTGAVTDGTYHVWLIQRSDTGVVDAMFSMSATSPTMPANYDRKRRIGSIIRKSGSILGFTQVGNVFTLNAAKNDVITTNPGTSAVLAAVSTPVGIKARAQIWVYVQQATSSARRTGLITSPDQADSVPVVGSNSNIVAGLSTSPGNASGEFFVRTNTSAQIRYRFDASDANLSIYINTAGWIDDQL